MYSIPPLPPQDHYELSAAQRRLWVLAQLPDASAAYNIPLHQFVEGPLDRAALERRLPDCPAPRVACVRPSSLSDGEPRQVVHTQLPVPIMFHDLARRDDAEDVGAYPRAGEAPGSPFDLAAGPLCASACCGWTRNGMCLLSTIDHIIADGVSLSVLARDLSRLYESARPVRLTACPLCRSDYPAYAAWQNRLLSGSARRAASRLLACRLVGRLAPS